MLQRTLTFSSLFKAIVHPPEFTREYQDEGGRIFLRAQNVRPGHIQNREPIFVSDAVYESGREARATVDELLLVRTGANHGDCARVTTEWAGAMVSSHTLRLIPHHEAPVCSLEFFFCAPSGRALLLGLRSGGTHGQINADNLRTLQLPNLLSCEPAMRKRADTIEQCRLLSRDKIIEAEKLLNASLNVKTDELAPALFYSSDFTELQKVNRFGAEYFMPCKQRVLDALAKQPGHLLNEHYQSVRELFDATDARHGEQVRNFDLTAALEPVLDDSMETMPAAEIGSTKKKFQAGDVVISRLRSYLREIAVVRTSPAIFAVGSSEFIVLRPRENAKSKLTPETLLIYLRSLPVQTILKWSQDGSAHPRFDEDDLLAIPVPDSVVRIAPKIDVLVNEALTARAEAARLLEAAKAEVERLVLKTSTT